MLLSGAATDHRVASEAWASGTRPVMPALLLAELVDDPGRRPRLRPASDRLAASSYLEGLDLERLDDAQSLQYRRGHPGNQSADRPLSDSHLDRP